MNGLLSGTGTEGQPNPSGKFILLFTIMQSSVEMLTNS